MEARDCSSIFRHCLSVKKEGDSYFPVRFSRELLKFYEGLDEGKAVRAHSCAGITMEFMTDAEEISFEYRSIAFCRPMVVFDFFENDVLMGTVREPDNSEKGKVTYIRQIKGRGKVTVYLPYCVHMTFQNLKLGQWEVCGQQEKKILFLGDSITQGMTVIHPSQSFANLTARLLGMDWINQGVGGYIFHKDSLTDVEKIQADLIFVAYGTNDYFQVSEGNMTLETFFQNMTGYLSTLKEKAGKTEIAVISPLWREDCVSIEDKKLFDQISQWILESCHKLGLKCMDGRTLVGHEGELLADGLHPNDMGANMMALNMEANLRKWGL